MASSSSPRAASQCKRDHAECPQLPRSPSARLSDSTVGSPTHVSASAAAPSGRVITAIRIYIDDQAELTVSGNTISGDIALPSGNHFLAIVAWDDTALS